MKLRTKIGVALVAVISSLAVLVGIQTPTAQAAGDGCGYARYDKLQGWSKDVGYPAPPDAQIGKIRLTATLEYVYCTPPANKIKLKNVTFCWTFLNGINPYLFDGVWFDAIYQNNNGKYLDPAPIYLNDNNQLQRCETVYLLGGLPGNMVNQWWNMTSQPNDMVGYTIIWNNRADQSGNLTYAGNSIRSINPAADPSYNGPYRWAGR